MSEEPEIERCVCGMTAWAMRRRSGKWRVVCNASQDGIACWHGPEADTVDAARGRWNTLMRAAKERSRLQADLYAAHRLVGEDKIKHCTCPDCTEHRERTKETTV